MDTTQHSVDSLRARGGRPPTMDAARRALRLVWGYEEFRTAQVRALEAILAGRDVLAVFPTGGGKSLCYQVPALLLDGVTIVVSPLISLMKDQIDAIAARGVNAAYLNSSLSPREADGVLAALARGDLRLLYVSPERFDSEDFTRAVASARVCLFAIDEAHCVSEWGHEFRPAYTRLGARRELFRDAPMVAVTATATPVVRRDIVDQLAMRNPAVQVGGFDRPNLHWSVIPTLDETAKLKATLKALRGTRGGSAIVYVSTQESAGQVARALVEAGHAADAYHAGLPTTRRKEVQEAFMRGDRKIVVATNAFGMGIDKPDIRLVLHYTMPATMEALYQEAGRGGRDGGDARAVLLHAAADRQTHEYLIQQAYPARERVEGVYCALLVASGPDGAVDNPARVAARALGATNPKAAYPALRILTKAGVVHRPAERRQQLRLLSRPSVDDLPVAWEELDARRRQELSKLESVVRYATRSGCRRRAILNYFRDDSPEEDCTGCDYCDQPRRPR